MRDLPLPTAPLDRLLRGLAPRRPARLVSQPAAATPSLVVRWARDEQDVRDAQRLRHDVFVTEMGARLSPPAGTPAGLDVDVFDAHCEHLLVRAPTRDDPRGVVVGTYRLLTPTAARRIGGCYADTEFDLTRLRPLRERMVELGRSCVHRDWRDGTVILALWNALADFMARNRLDTMLGCASVPMHDGGHAAASLWARLRATHLAPIEHRVQPRLPLPVDELRQDLDVEPPALIKGYLRCGARARRSGLGPGLPHGRPADPAAASGRRATLPQALPRRLSRAAAGARRLLAFAELVVHERGDRVVRRLLVGTVALELDLRADARGQHHHAHDALGVHAPAVAADEDLAAERAGQLGQLGRSAGVQPELIADGERRSNHRQRG